MTAVLDPKLLKRADSFLDGDSQQDAATRLGRRLFEVFRADKEGRISSQVRNLQQIAVSAPRLADIEDFIKHQMGREGEVFKKWRQVGDLVLEQLGGLRKEANQLSADEEQRLLLRLHLARGWVRAVVGAYLYEKAMREMEGHS